MKLAPLVRPVIKIAIGVGILAWLIAAVDVHQMLLAFQRGSPTWIAAGAGLFAIATVVVALRLYVLFRSLRLPLRDALRVTLASYFFNQLLPTGFGGDAYRSVRLKRVSGNWTSAIGLLAFERLVGASALLLPALVIATGTYGVLHVFRLLLSRLPRPAGWQAVLLILLIAMSAVLASRFRRHVHTFRLRLGEVRKHLTLKVVTIAFAVSLVHHALRILGVVAFLAAFGWHVPAGDVTIVMALALLASLVPVSVGALGIREGVLVYGFGLFDVPPAEGLTVALLIRLVAIASGIAGALVLWGEGELAPPKSQE